MPGYGHQSQHLGALPCLNSNIFVFEACTHKVGSAGLMQPETVMTMDMQKWMCSCRGPAGSQSICLTEAQGVGASIRQTLAWLHDMHGCNLLCVCACSCKYPCDQCTAKASWHPESWSAQFTTRHGSAVLLNCPSSFGCPTAPKDIMLTGTGEDGWRHVDF